MHTRPEAPPVMVVNKKTTKGESPCHPAWPIQVVVKSESDLGPVELNVLCYGNGKYVAVGSSVLGESLDAINWKIKKSRIGDRPYPYPSMYPQDIIYGNGKYVFVDAVSSVGVSSDGVNWDIRDLSGAIPYAVAFGNGLFVVLGRSGDYYYSSNGTSWTQKKLIYQSATGNLTHEYEMQGVCFGNNKFVGVGGPAMSGDGNPPVAGNVITSFDGINWVGQPPLLTDTAGFFMDVCFGNNLFVAVSGRGAVYSSPDGITWTKRRADGSYGDPGLRKVCYGNGIFVAIGEEGLIVSSANGTSWTNRPRPSEVSNDYFFEGLTYGNGRFVAMGYLRPSDPMSQGVLMLISPDGMTWTKETPKFTRM